MIVPKTVELIAEIEDQFSEQIESQVSPSPYDTAWVALIPDKTDFSSPLFPSSLKWIQDNQNDDGSWSQQKPIFFQGLIVNTLMCCICLKKWNVSSELVIKGETYIQKNLDNILKDKVDGIGFELIFPTLIDLAKNYELNIPTAGDAIDKYKQVKEMKLSKIPIAAIYAKKTTLSYSLEFLETQHEDIDFEKIKINQDQNGSYCTSPASTAFILLHSEDEKAENYLRSLVTKTGGYVPVVWPIDNMEASWGLNYIHKLNVASDFKKLIARFTEHLTKNWNAQTGVAWSSQLAIPDLDDTCVAFKSLKDFGVEVSSDAFLYYQKNGEFFGFEGERNANPSYVANLIHGLEAATDFPDRLKHIEISLQLLDSLYKDNVIDKWHLSEYYLISRLTFTSQEFRKQEIYEHVVKSQNSDGGWGRELSTAEETCYALIYLLNSDMPLDKIMVGKAIEYLLNSKGNTDIALWISKGLYAPIRLNNLLVNSTLISLINHGTRNDD